MRLPLCPLMALMAAGALLLGPAATLSQERQREGVAVKPGLHRQKLELSDGSTLRYTIFVPQELTSEHSRPLVLALHYAGRVTAWYGGGFLKQLVLPALKDLGAILVAPDCPGDGWHREPASTAVVELLEHLERSPHVDRQRLAVTGYSLGGHGAWHLVALYPGLFSAAIPISAAVPLSSGTPERVLESFRRTPVYVLHGRLDEMFPVDEVESAVARLEAQALPVRLRVIDGLSHYDTSSFRRPLRQTIPWIQEIWREPPPEKPATD